MKPLFYHLHIPKKSRALLWDMDGVLVDSLGLDIAVAAPLFSEALGRPVTLTADYIRSIFALDPKRFIAAIMDHLLAGTLLEGRERIEADILARYEEMRRTARFPLLPGVAEVLEAARGAGLKMAVVSNNPQKDLEVILQQCGLYKQFNVVVGNDVKDGDIFLQKKPAPDFYLYGMRALGVAGEEAVVFEDSVLGCQAGFAAGAHVIGLLTGSADEKALRALTPPPHQILPNLTSHPIQ